MSGETNVYLHVYAGVLTALVAFPAMLIQVMISSDPTHQITFKTALVIENIIYVLFGAALGAIIGLVVQALTFSTSTPHADSYGVLFEKS